MRSSIVRFIRTSIRVRLAAIIAAAVLSAVVVSSAGSAWRETERRFQSSQEEIAAIANAIASAVVRPLAAGNRSDVAQTLVAIRQMRGITFAQVTDASGRLVAQIGQSVILESGGQHVTANSEISLFAPLVLRNYLYETPIVSGSERIGYLRIIADISHLRGALVDSLLAALLIGLVATSLALVLAGRLQQSITRPIRELTAAMQETGAEQDYTHTVTKMSDDETGIMVDAFNGMMREIQVRDQRLAEHRDRLEVEVDERTADLKAATLAAESANAAKSDFLATMSHEIRTPLNGMLVMAELLATGDLPVKLQRHADVIVSSGQSLIAIINDILDLSKIEAGRLELEKVPVAPRAVMEQVVNLFSARAASRGLELVCYADPSVPEEVLADPVRLNQVLANLINNALKFTEKGHVALWIDTVDGGSKGSARLRFRVEDTGIGIPKDKLETIFDPFSQADQSTTRKFGGTGIGLTISRKLVAAMGDTLQVESEVGRGSTFYFTAECEIVTSATSPALPEAGARTVMIALDQPAGRDTLVRIVNDLGYRAVVADGPSAGWAVDGAAPHAIFAEPQRIDRLGFPGEVRAYTIAVVAVGDTGAGGLIDDGRAAASILRPILPSDVRSALLDLSTAQGQRPARARSGAGSQNHTMEFKGLHVLAADDSAVNREVLSEALARLGVKVTLVEDGRQAVEALRRRRFDLVFMDCSMPGMDGYAATRLIRSEEAERGGEHTPVVALTAHVAGNDADAWRKAGMDGYMTKPFTLKSMTACFERWAKPAEVRRTAAGAEVAAPVDADEASPGLMTLNAAALDEVRAMQAPGDDLVGRIAGLYRTHAPAALVNLSQVATEGESSALAEAAHAMKSLCRNIGAERLGAMLDVIERGARADHAPCSREQIAALEAELRHVLARLDEIIAGAGPDMPQALSA